MLTLLPWRSTPWGPLIQSFQPMEASQFWTFISGCVESSFPVLSLILTVPSKQETSILKLSVLCPTEQCCWMGPAPCQSQRPGILKGKIEKVFCHGCYFVCFQSLYYWLQYYAAGIITWCVRAARSARSSGDLHLTQQWEGFPGGSSGKASACQRRRYKRYKFDPWVGKISWRRKWQFTPVFLPGKSHGQRSLRGVAKSWTWLRNWACTQ